MLLVSVDPAKQTTDISKSSCRLKHTQGIELHIMNFANYSKEFE